ncbi:hypothetical protein TTHERM_00420110 (macronuclear) [Tetrahymena thermophila SB210]|uniref:Uncharacterized protein n=1 Tax=Tetrahymena thermophila (strain SB210) TaxID=312017 RepID=I7M072_TETTS|nr:hypothetical protein TTHERM_00420110 [Tetrahymena thermophila SB210]EAR85603.1 hypothetical protein TTHERM_00420110 [Tetrahymena thermophila SB210]|eukprot:XP_001033266.1 hypothetical protein TTHERM_00420110 [Tetrahymena thermophila SB210]
MKTSFFSILQSPRKTVQSKFDHNKQQQMLLQSFELYTIEREVLKELDSLSKKHSIQFFPSQPGSKSKIKNGNNFKISFPVKNNNLILSPKEIKQTQENEQKPSRFNHFDAFQSTLKEQNNIQQDKISINRDFNENNQKKRIVIQKKSWVSPIVQKQNQLKRQQQLLHQRQIQSISTNRSQDVSFQVEATSSSIYSLGDKKKCIEQVKKQSHSFYGEAKAKSNDNNKNMSQLAPTQLSNLCHLPSFNSSFRVQKMNKHSFCSSNRNIDRQRSLSNTSYSLLEPWVKQELYKTITEPKNKNNNSFDFYFYDDNIGVNVKTDVSFYKKSIDLKK